LAGCLTVAQGDAQSCAESDSMLMLAPAHTHIESDVITPVLGHRRTNPGHRYFAQTLEDMDDSEFKQSELKKYYDAEWEKMSNSTKLKVQRIQKRCKDKKVLVSGMPRSGSTSLMTVAHIMLFFCDEKYSPPDEAETSLYVDDPYTCNKHAPQPKFCWDYFKHRRTAIFKTHEARPDTRKSLPDMIFFSHRKPDDMMTSQWISFYSSCTTPPCANWPNSMRELERQACLYDKFDSKKIVYDMSLERLHAHQYQVLLDVASAVGVVHGHPSQFSDVLNHIANIYNAVSARIQTGKQVSHQSADHEYYKQVASEQLTAGWNYSDPSGAQPVSWVTGKK